MASKKKKMGTAGRIALAMLDAVPLEWILEPLLSRILDRLEEDTTVARVAEKPLVAFGIALAKKYPGKIVVDEEEA